MLARDLSLALQALGDPQIAEHSQRFFKSGPGEYGEGDMFIGIRVPVVRKQAARFRDLSLGEVSKVLQSPLHEERLCALIILTLQFARADEARQEAIYAFYLDHTDHINNWDLVDCSAHKNRGSVVAEPEPLDTLSTGRFRQPVGAPHRGDGHLPLYPARRF